MKLLKKENGLMKLSLQIGDYSFEFEKEEKNIALK